MYGILGEEDDDAETLKVLVQRLTKNPTMRFRMKGFGGFGDLLKKGARQLQDFRNGGCQRFVVCHDADGPDPRGPRQEVVRRVIEPSGIKSEYCVVIPVHEIEAWILADIQAVSNVITSWRPTQFKENPEGVTNPKERLKSDSRKDNNRPRYDPATHNPKIAKYLELDVVRKRCPSFEHLASFVVGKPT
jgi:hypothetical protein